MLKRKLLAFVIVVAMLMSIMAPGFAFNYVTAPGTTPSSSNTVFSPGTTTQSDYTVVFEKNTAKVGDMVSLVIKVLDKEGKVVTDKKVLETIYKSGLTLNADPRTLVFDTNRSGWIDTNDGSLISATVNDAVYQTAYPVNNITTTDIRILPSSDVTGFVVASPGTVQFGFISAGQMSFYVANYGRVWVTGSPSIIIDEQRKSVNYDDARLYLSGAAPNVSYLSGNTNPLETYPETVLITVPGANYNSAAKAVLTKDDKVLAIIDLVNSAKNINNAKDINNDGIVDGYKVVLPPMSAGHKYVLTVYNEVNYSNWEFGYGRNYYSVGAVNITPQAAKFELVAPADKVLAAGISDPVTFTLNDKLPNGNTSADNKNLAVDFAKFVRFTVLKSDNKTKDTEVKYVDANEKIANGSWYLVTDDGLKAVSLDTNNNIVLGDPVANSYEKDSGKITVKAKIPNGDYLKIEAAYTDYVGNLYEVKNKKLQDFEETFVVANLEAKPGTLTMEPSTINANEYRNVKFTVKDVHGNPVSGAEIKFSSPIVYLGGTGSTAVGNVGTAVKTGDDGTVTATLFSAFPTSIAVSVSVPVEKTLTLTINPSQQTGATVVFTIGSDKYTVNGVEKTMDAAPYVKDGRTLVPARYIADAINARSYYDQDTKVVTFVKGDTIVKFTLGSNKMQVIKNGVVVATQTMETKATTVDASGKDVGRTFILARYLAEAFGYKVDYAKDASGVETVTIY